MTETPSYIVSVDPGGIHVGVAVFERVEGSWVCRRATEMTPREFEDWLAETLHIVEHTLIVEEWRLFADRAKEQTGSAMETSQLIGVIKYIHRKAAPPNNDIVWQQPTIKHPTRSVLNSRNVEITDKIDRGYSDHAIDAILHGYYYIIKILNEPITN